ncbi:MAG: DUF1513 domain-containing protein [Candidatus Dactylopiibacterium sp.]|nr:DUF1513 domain-containing protein [Candidatus Dactylopiibacterium sp.]
MTLRTTDRRQFLRGLSALSALALLPAAQAAAPPTVLAAAWLAGGDLPAPLAQGAGHYVGTLRIDWSARQIHMLGAIPVPHRPHGIVAMPGGEGFYAVAFRHGRWLLAADARGRELRRVDLASEPGGRTFNGHVELSPDGQWLFTTEVVPATGEGWISVRSARTLARVAQLRSGGVEPHQLLLDDEGMMLVANGGLRWTRDDQKIGVEHMDSSLARVNPENGALLGQWRLRDARLSLRHLAWNMQPSGRRVLGIALQGNHDAPEQRRAAPALALWDGQALDIPSQSPLGLGYIGDIAPGPGGGFLMSAEIHDRVVFWHPGEAEKLFLIADMSRAAALAPSGAERSLFIGGEKGVARWELNRPAAPLPWPFPIAPDHHWAVLEG